MLITKIKLQFFKIVYYVYICLYLISYVRLLLIDRTLDDDVVIVIVFCVCIVVSHPIKRETQIKNEPSPLRTPVLTSPLDLRIWKKP